MTLTPEKIAVVAAAAAVVFWPQLRMVWERARLAGGKAAAAGGPDRDRTIQTLLTTQDAARDLGSSKAADLIGQAIVQLVTGGPSK